MTFFWIREGFLELLMFLRRRFGATELGVIWMMLAVLKRSEIKRWSGKK
ncbi:MAG: hypothetical protein RMJ28_04260 [Nitrososphaerota archaeon]|nr:hypothetical protein [Nitrososphaerota archaeon]